MGSVVVVDVVRVLGLGLSLRLRCRRAPLRALSGPWPCSGACSFNYLHVCVGVSVGVYVCRRGEQLSQYCKGCGANWLWPPGLVRMCVCVCVHAHTHVCMHAVCSLARSLRMCACIHSNVRECV